MSKFKTVNLEELITPQEEEEEVITEPVEVQEEESIQENKKTITLDFKMLSMVKHLKTTNVSLNELSSLIKDLIEIIQENNREQKMILEKIAKKEYPEVQFPKIQEVKITNHQKVKDPNIVVNPPEVKIDVTPIVEAIKQGFAEMEINIPTMEVKGGEPRVHPTKSKPKWVSFDNYYLKNITASLSGSDTILFLPSQLIQNSETIRLNMGLPLSNADYTIIGNKITLPGRDETSSQIEVRGQTR